MSKVGDVLNVPNYLAAPSRDELVRLMLSNNIEKHTEHRYFDISFDGKVWTAWYFEKAKVKIQPRGKKVVSGAAG